LSPNHTHAQVRVVIGSLEGNTQSFGKDIVVRALRSAGFKVTDLGVDVPPEIFVETALEKNAGIIAISIHVTETIPHLKDLVSIIHSKKLVGKVKTVIGGQAVSEETRKTYGLDAYAEDALDCVEKVRELSNSK
jgi:5-methyltetrahydrofolate--homocysteine methyltransferase